MPNSLPSAAEMRAKQAMQQQNDSQIAHSILSHIGTKLNELLDSGSKEVSFTVNLAQFRPTAGAIKTVTEELKEAGYVADTEYPSQYPALSATSQDLAKQGIVLTVNSNANAEWPMMTVRWAETLDVCA